MRVGARNRRRLAHALVWVPRRVNGPITVRWLLRKAPERTAAVPACPALRACTATFIYHRTKHVPCARCARSRKVSKFSLLMRVLLMVNLG